MSNNKKFNLREAKPRSTLPSIDLLPRLYNGKTVLIADFDGGYHALNSMEKHYWHSSRFPDITFTPLSSPEIISFLAFDLSRPSDTTASLIVRTNEGIYINPGNAIYLTRDSFGGQYSKSSFHLCEEELCKKRDQALKINNIYLGEKDFGFVPWNSFKTGKITIEEFARGGLARALEHTREDLARKLFDICKKNCKWDVAELEYLEPAKKPTIELLRLNCNTYTTEIKGRAGLNWRDERDYPDSKYYSSVDYFNSWFGKIKTNKGKEVQ